MSKFANKSEAIAVGDLSALTSSLRSELREGLANIPQELREHRSWLCWRVSSIDPNTGKFQKLPIYPRSGELRKGAQGSPEDLRDLGSFDDALVRFESDPTLAGLGVAMLEQFGLIALDVDKCIANETLRPDVADLTEHTYCEISPSGTGVRAFWKGTARNGRTDGFEVYATSQFVTITGQQRANFYRLFGNRTLPSIDQETRAQLESCCGVTVSSERPPGGPLQVAAQQDSRLRALADAGLYERDLRNGKHSIRCPFEHEHSDPGRRGGDGDTVYFQPHTNGYEKGHIHCAHAHCGDRTQRQFWQAIGFDEDAHSIAGVFSPIAEDEWPDPIPLPLIPPVPAFNLELLPRSLRGWVADIAERLQIPPDVPAMGAVTALSSAIGRRVRIRPKQHDRWEVVPNLWGMVVAPPGYKKSPALTEVMRPLHILETRANEEHQRALATWELENERVAAYNSAAKAAVRGKLKHDGTSEPPQLLTQPEEPIANRFLVNDFSLEALGEVMIGNENGVLAFGDELYGLLKNADKPGNELLHSFLLSAWNGEGAFTFDRIGRGRRHVPNVCLSILGGIQPGRLVDYLTNGGRSGGAIDSGFLNRFQLLTWPDFQAAWILVDRVPDMAAQETYQGIFERLAGNGHFPNLEGKATASSGGDVRHFDTEAQQEFYQWMVFSDN